MDQPIRIQFDSRISICLHLTEVFFNQQNIEALITGVRRNLPRRVIVDIGDEKGEAGALEFLFTKDTTEHQNPRFLMFHDGTYPGGKPFHIAAFADSAQPAWFVPSQMLDEHGITYTSDADLRWQINQVLAELYPETDEQSG